MSEPLLKPLFTKAELVDVLELVGVTDELVLPAPLMDPLRVLEPPTTKAELVDVEELLGARDELVLPAPLTEPLREPLLEPLNTKLCD